MRTVAVERLFHAGPSRREEGGVVDQTGEERVHTPERKRVGSATGETVAVHVEATLDAPCPADALFAVVEDLASYPAWLTIVARAVPDTPAAGDPGPAWLVDLRARLGPLARSKRLRMARTVLDAPGHVAFGRVEHDGRSHSAWDLTADVVPVEGGSRLTMGLHYGGTLFGPVLERLLHDEIARAKPRLVALVAP